MDEYYARGVDWGAALPADALSGHSLDPGDWTMPRIDAYLPQNHTINAQTNE